MTRSWILLIASWQCFICFFPSMYLQGESGLVFGIFMPLVIYAKTCLSTCFFFSCFWCINVPFLYPTSVQTRNSFDPNKYLATRSPHIFGCYFRGLFALILVNLSSVSWQCFFAQFLLLVLPIVTWCQYSLLGMLEMCIRKNVALNHLY